MSEEPIGLPNSPDFATPIRRAAFRFCDAMVPSVDGDLEFDRVTQGRQSQGYSACADLGHAMLVSLGVIERALINRDIGGERGVRYDIGQNVSKLYNGARHLGVWVDYAPFRVPKLGDVVLIGRHSAGENEHVLVFRQLTEAEFQGTWWQSYDYGQVEPADSSRPFAASSTICTRHRVGNRLDGREILGWIDLDKVAEKLALAP